MIEKLKELIKSNEYTYSAAKTMYDFLQNLPSDISYSISPEFRKSYDETVNLIKNPSLYVINADDHNRFSKKAVDNFKLQTASDIKQIYKPGVMWQNILDDVPTMAAWRAQKDDKILHDALYRFYCTDLIMAHSGDFYYWDLESPDFNFKRQAYMVIKRYKELISSGLNINPATISTTDIGQNMYVKYRDRKLTFKLLRHSYYLDRMIKNGLLNTNNPVIGELGCGAGELAITAKKCLPNVKYICFDLPQTLLVSSYNVLMTYPGLKIGVYEDFMNAGKITKDDLSKFDIIMLPNWCIEWLDEDLLDLFVNVGSLSEMDLPIIENYLNHIERLCKGHFYTVNRNVTVSEWGAEDIPFDKFPLSNKTKIVSKQYDVASDNFHGRYGTGKINYWEMIVKYLK